MLTLHSEELRSEGPGATHEDLTGLLRVGDSSGVSRSTRRVPGDEELNVSSPEHSSDIFWPKWASRRVVHATPNSSYATY